MTLDPRISLYLNLACVALVAIAAYLGAQQGFVAAHPGWVLAIGAAIAAINGVLHAIPSKPGATEQFPLGPSK